MDQERLKQKEKLGIRILENCRNELYCRFPYLDSAFAGMDFRGTEKIRGIGTDGDFFCFCPDDLLKMYVECPEQVRRGYLHMLLHCLYLHILKDEGWEERIWNLACDMAAELMLQQELPEESPENTYRKEKKSEAIGRECLRLLHGRAPSAEHLCRLLGEKVFPFSLEEMEQAFYFDDHSLWIKNRDSLRAQELERKWEKLGAAAGESKKGLGGTRGDQAGSEVQDMEMTCTSRYDYRRFLKQFALLREEAELDMESFDYIYYNYGLEHYGSLPLIEPLEYKEGHKLEELVIAIDTSGSCSTDTVRHFLEETYAILGEKENFFRKMKVYLIQCDCCLQDIKLIRSREEWEEYSGKIRIQGRAGTDFTPVFRYIEELREKKELRHLKALIYFTDGDGVYPREAPDYETAFVFVKKTAGMELVPAWARRLLVR